MQARAILRHERDGDHRPKRAVHLPRALQLRKRPACELVHFERALDALRIGTLQARGRRGVHTRELGVERGPAFGGGPGIEPRAHRGIGRRQSREAVLERLEVQHRPADEQRNSAARANRGNRFDRIGAEPRRRVGFDRIEDVDQMMRHPRARRGVGLRRADVHAAIHLRGIHADDLDREALRERERERGLAGSGRAHQQHGRNSGAHPNPPQRCREQAMPRVTATDRA